MNLATFMPNMNIGSFGSSFKAFLKRKGLPLLLVKFQQIPKVVNIELTNNCNLQCAKCSTYDAKRGKGSMTSDLFYKILSDIRDSGGDTTVTFTGGGEPTLHPSLVEFVLAAKKGKNIRAVRLVTNGLGLNESLIAKLIEAGVDEISLSLDTADRNIYKKINRVDGFDAVVRNINALNEARRGVGLKTVMKVTLYKDDKAEVSKIKEMFGDKFHAIRFSGMHKWLGLRGKQKSMRSTEPCPYPFYHVQILWDGQITLCCNDSMEGFINMANANEVSLSEYWRNNEKLNAVRKALISGNLKMFPVCDNCDVHLYVHDKKL